MEALQRIQTREKLLQKIIQIFKDIHPVAIHQFGSGATGYRDEWSDLDIWITFKDDQMGDILKKQKKIFQSVGTEVIVHTSKRNNPLGGSATLIIYEIDGGLFQVDFYLAPQINSVILEDAKLLYGDDSLPRGQWKMDTKAKERHILSKDITFLVVMSFIFIKGIKRKWERTDLEELIQKIYGRIEEKSGKKLSVLPEQISPQLIYALLDNLWPLANDKQRAAIEKINLFAHNILG